MSSPPSNHHTALEPYNNSPKTALGDKKNKKKRRKRTGLPIPPNFFFSAYSPTHPPPRSLPPSFDIANCKTADDALSQDSHGT